MSPGFSLFLDATRITAAMVVLLSHYGAESITSSVFWVFNIFSSSAVTVFFVLSGYTIAWVTEQREADWLSYSVARFCRIYSVVLPAIVLTVVLDLAGRAINPAFYAPYTYFDSWFGYAQILSSVLFLNESWLTRISLFSNGSYWSLNYEVWYYIAFGVYCFVASPRYRYVAVLICMLIAGGRIVELAPVWICGVAVRHFERNHAPALRWSLLLLVACVSFVLAGDVIVSSPWIGRHGLLGRGIATWMAGHPPVWDYLSGLAIGLGFLAAAEITREWRPPATMVRQIRWSAGMTFSVYLYHRPLMLCLAAILPGSIENNYKRAAVLVITLLTITALSYATERRKSQLKPFAMGLMLSILPAKRAALTMSDSSGLK